MSRLTLRLPESLHKALVRRAEEEGVSLNQYLVYLLAQQSAPAYDVKLARNEDLARQDRAYEELLQSLGPATHEQVRTALELREPTDPEPGLDPDLVDRVRRRLANEKKAPQS